MLGFLEIGQQMWVCSLYAQRPTADNIVSFSENPFNYDLNDLDLDNFCLTIQREMQEITAASL